MLNLPVFLLSKPLSNRSTPGPETASMLSDGYVSAASTSRSVRCEWMDFRAIDQLCRLKLFSPGTIEEDLVSIRFPDGRELGGARPIQAEVDPAWLVPPPQNPFCHGKGACLELILIANGRVDVVPKIFHAVDLL
jgi:hypothetical protein